MKANFSLSKKQLLPPVLTSGALKWIALITMFIDHIGAIILEKGAISAYNQGLPTALSYDVSLLLSKMVIAGAQKEDNASIKPVVFPRFIYGSMPLHLYKIPRAAHQREA